MRIVTYSHLLFKPQSCVMSFSTSIRFPVFMRAAHRDPVDGSATVRGRSTALHTHIPDGTLFLYERSGHEHR